MDSKTRKWQVEPGLVAMLSDTVGFVRDLPHQLVASFRSTLEEARQADLLLHVVDASHAQAAEQIDTVSSVLADLGCDSSRVIVVLNKIDRVPDPLELMMLRPERGAWICISAARGDGVDELSQLVADIRRHDSIWVRISAPAGEGRLQALAHARCRIRNPRYVGDRWTAEINVEPGVLAQFQRSCRDVACEPLAG